MAWMKRTKSEDGKRTFYGDRPLRWVVEERIRSLQQVNYYNIDVDNQYCTVITDLLEMAEALGYRVEIAESNSTVGVFLAGGQLLTEFHLRENYWPLSFVQSLHHTIGKTLENQQGAADLEKLGRGSLYDNTWFRIAMLTEKYKRQGYFFKVNVAWPSFTVIAPKIDWVDWKDEHRRNFAYSVGALVELPAWVQQREEMFRAEYEQRAMRDIIEHYCVPLLPAEVWHVGFCRHNIDQPSQIIIHSRLENIEYECDLSFEGMAEFYDVMQKIRDNTCRYYDESQGLPEDLVKYKNALIPELTDEWHRQLARWGETVVKMSYDVVDREWLVIFDEKTGRIYKPDKPSRRLLFLDLVKEYVRQDYEITRNNYRVMATL